MRKILTANICKKERRKELEEFAKKKEKKFIKAYK